jgi:mono/diheme cytochrome c family protein
MRGRRELLRVASVSVLVALSGCHVDMWRQPKLIAEHESGFFRDGSASRLPARNTVARGGLREDEGFYTGAVAGTLVESSPVPVTRESLERGKQQFGIHCAPCHGALGYGNGMIAQRGLAMRRKPGNYHTDRLRGMPIGFYYDVITHGSGVMFSAAARVAPRDRWHIAHYIRALQLSQHAKLADVPEAERRALGAGPSAANGGKRR